MKILVTGGTGFLGRHLAQALISDSHQIYLAGRKFENVDKLLQLGVTAVAFDLRDQPAVRRACAGMDVVCHAGALSSPWGPRAEFFATNVGGTQAIIDGCRQYGVGRLIYISSPSVLFDGHDHINATEATPYPRQFMSVYALTKKLAEEAVNSATDLNTITLRPKAIFGPGDKALLPRLVAAARAGRLPMVGDGRNQVDLTYVGNVVQAIQLAIQKPAVKGLYTITNDEHVMLWDVIKMVLERLGISTRLRPMSPTFAATLAGLMELLANVTGKEPLLTRYSVALLHCTQTYDISKAKQALGYSPPVSVAEGVERTIASLQQASDHA